MEGFFSPMESIQKLNHNNLEKLKDFRTNLRKSRRPNSSYTQFTSPSYIRMKNPILYDMFPIHKTNLTFKSNDQNKDDQIEQNEFNNICESKIVSLNSYRCYPRLPSSYQKIFTSICSKKIHQIASLFNNITLQNCRKARTFNNQMQLIKNDFDKKKFIKYLSRLFLIRKTDPLDKFLKSFSGMKQICINNSLYIKKIDQSKNLNTNCYSHKYYKFFQKKVKLSQININLPWPKRTEFLEEKKKSFSIIK